MFTGILGIKKNPMARMLKILDLLLLLIILIFLKIPSF